MHKSAITIVHGSKALSIQDRGRRGYLRYGVTEAGPMDWISFTFAHQINSLNGDGAAFEIGPAPTAFCLHGPGIWVSVSGKGHQVTLDQSGIKTPGVFYWPEGTELRFAPDARGMWSYLCLAGRFDLAPVLNSYASHSRSALSPWPKGKLQDGDQIPVLTSGERLHACEYQNPLTDDTDKNKIRVIRGPQWDQFGPLDKKLFLEQDWSVSPKIDRMGYWLDGQPLVNEKRSEIVSDGIVCGSVQVPGNGSPVVLMADRQPTGGYPKIATVIRADLPRLAQMRPGTRFKIQAIDVSLASKMLLEITKSLKKPKPAIRHDLSHEMLLSVNLISGVTAGDI